MHSPVFKLSAPLWWTRGMAKLHVHHHLRLHLLAPHAGVHRLRQRVRSRLQRGGQLHRPAGCYLPGEERPGREPQCSRPQDARLTAQPARMHLCVGGRSVTRPTPHPLTLNAAHALLPSRSGATPRCPPRTLCPPGCWLWAAAPSCWALPPVSVHRCSRGRWPVGELVPAVPSRRPAPCAGTDAGPRLAATPVLHVGVACDIAVYKTPQASRCPDASSSALHLADGHRVMQAMGVKMTRLTNSRGEQLTA